MMLMLTRLESDGFCLMSHVTPVYKLTCEWADWVPPAYFTPKETESWCDHTQRQCELIIKKTPISHLCKVFLWQQHSATNLLFWVILNTLLLQLQSEMMTQLSCMSLVLWLRETHTHRHTVTHTVPTRHTPSCNTKLQITANKVDYFNLYNTLRT